MQNDATALCRNDMHTAQEKIKHGSWKLVAFIQPVSCINVDLFLINVKTVLHCCKLKSACSRVHQQCHLSSTANAQVAARKIVSRMASDIPADH